MITRQTNPKVTVGKKLVWARAPYEPRPGPIMADLVGRDEEATMVAAAWVGGPRSQPLAPLLVGRPGCGKGRLVIELARRMGLKLYVCQGYDNADASELGCTLVPSDEGNGRIDYVLSHLATSMLSGGVCFVDEIGKFPGRALSLLASVLDDRRYIDLDLIGERIEAHRDFRFIAATNGEDIDGLPDFLRSRLFPVIRVEAPERREIDDIVCNQFPGEQRAMKERLEWFWRLWEEEPGELDPPTPRDALQVFWLAAKLAALDGKPAGDEPFEDDLGAPEMRLDHLKRALRQFWEGRPC